MNEIPTLDKQSWIPIFFVFILLIKLISKKIFFIAFSKLNSLENFLSFENSNYFFFLWFLTLLGNLIRIFLLYVFLSTSPSFEIENNLKPYNFFLILNGLFFLFFIFKLSLNKLIAYIFKKELFFKDTSKIKVFYLWKETKMNFIASLLVVYSPIEPNFIFIFLLIYLICLYTLKYKNWINKIKISFNFSPYYIILYICTVECLPILVIFNSTIFFKK